MLAEVVLEAIFNVKVNIPGAMIGAPIAVAKPYLSAMYHLVTRDYRFKKCRAGLLESSALQLEAMRGTGKSLTAKNKDLVPVQALPELVAKPEKVEPLFSIKVSLDLSGEEKPKRKRKKKASAEE